MWARSHYPPQPPLHYVLTWSLDGLVNEYMRPCEHIIDGMDALCQPLQDVEQLTLDGTPYEALNPSGGFGGLLAQLSGQINTANYKTLHHPGHCQTMQALLQQHPHPTELKQALADALPCTEHDQVVMHVEVSSWVNGQTQTRALLHTFYPQTLFNQYFLAIQFTTAAGICSVVDIVLSHRGEFKGYVTHDQISLGAVLINPFGQYLRCPPLERFLSQLDSSK